MGVCRKPAYPLESGPVGLLLWTHDVVMLRGGGRGVAPGYTCRTGVGGLASPRGRDIPHPNSASSPEGWGAKQLPSLHPPFAQHVLSVGYNTPCRVAGLRVTR